MLRVECQPESGRRRRDFASEIRRAPRPRNRAARSTRAWRRTRPARPRAAASAASPRARERFYERGAGALARSPLARISAARCATSRRYPVAALVAVVLARRRHRRHDGHADDPRGRLPQGAAALRGTRTAVAGPGRIAGPADRADRQPRPRPALYARWRDTFGSAIARIAASTGVRDGADGRPDGDGAGSSGDAGVLLGLSASTPRGRRARFRRRQRRADTPRAVLSHRALGKPVRPQRRRHWAPRSGSTTSRTCVVGVMPERFWFCRP